MPTLPNPQEIQRKTPQPSTVMPMINYPSVDDSLGIALENVGNDVYQYALSEKARMDSVIVDDAKNQYLQKALELQNEYIQIKGRNAVDQDIVKDYTDKLNAFSEDISSNLKNRTQRDAWNSYYGTARTQFIAGVMNHKLSESDTYATEVYKNTNSTRIQTAHSNWGDTEVVNQAASDITNNVIKEKVRTGWSDERTEAELTENLGTLWAGVTAQYINAKQYNVARKLLDKHQEVIGINNVTSLNNAIDNGEKIDLSQQKFEEIITTIDDFEKQRNAARAIGGEIGDATLDRVKEWQTEQTIMHNEEVQRIADVQKQEADNEERQITELYLNKEYVKAFEALKNARYIEDKTILGDKIEKAAEGSTEFDNFNPATYATLSEIVYTDSFSITDKEIYRYVGLGKKGGITTTQAEALVKHLDSVTKEKAAQYSTEQKVIFDNLKRDRNDKLFGEGSEGDLEYAKQVEAYINWLDKNPDTPPSEYYKRILEINKPNILEKIFLRQETVTPEEIRISKPKNIIRRKINPEEDEKRQQAIKILEDNNRVVNEETIKIVMDQL